VALGLVALLCAASGIKAQPLQQAAAPAADALLLSGDHFIVVFTIKPDKAADFEAAWTDQGKAGRSDKADIRNWARYQDPQGQCRDSGGAPPPSQILYLFDLNPPSRL
jgi:hypothetical protein